MNIVLVEPEIPQNTGNIGRLCVATNSTLHLVEPLGFEISDKQLRRAGLDYWKFINLKTYCNWEQFEELNSPKVHLLTTKGTKPYTEVAYKPNDFLILGSESKGLPDKMHQQYPESRIKIPLYSDKVRSLNIANAASIVLYEALRQINH